LRRNLFWAVQAALAGTTAMVSPAAAQVDDLVQRALALHAGGRPGDAYALLAPHTAARAGDADFDYALGLAAADSGHPGIAIAAFQRVLAAQPANVQARAELARVYAMGGDIDTARAEFDTVLNDPTVPDPVRQRVGRLVRTYDRTIAGGGDTLTGYLDAEAGYDTNINSATDRSSITLPLFAFLGPATLSGAGRSTEDGYYQVQGGLSAGTALSRQTRAFASILGFWRDNFEHDAFDQAAVTGTAGVSHSFANRHSLSISAQGQRFWLDREGYRTGAGAIVQYSLPVSKGAVASLQGQYYRFDYDGDPVRDADRIGGTASVAGRTWFASAAGGRERTVRASARQLGFRYAAGQLGWEQPVSRTVALTGGAQIEHRDYQSADPLFLRARVDTQFDASLGVRLVLGQGVSVRPRVTYTRNHSNIALYDYSRVTAAMGLRLEF
jgi:tetratricopeptide (TPR) repeat protein